MKKVYRLLVDGETVDFDAMSIDDAGNALNESSAEKMFTYENNPIIVNISEMNLVPAAGSEYSPLTDGFPFIGESNPVAARFVNFARFALVIDNVVKIKTFFDPSTEYGSRLNAVFLSNPTFLPPEITE
jgi:hypothetical protein